MKKNEKLLCFGKWTSIIGNIVFDYACSRTIVSKYNKSAFILAIYQSSESIINIIFNLIGGVTADKSNKKKILIITDFLSAILCAGFGFFVETKLMVYVMIFVNVCLSITHAFNAPTYKAIVREAILECRISSYNAISNAGTELMRLISPALGVVLVNTVGVKSALYFNALTFFLSALSEMRLTNIKVIENVNGKQNFILDIYEGILYIYRERQLLLLVIASSLVNFFLAGYNLLIPYTDVMYKIEIENIYSKILIIEAGGSIIGSYLNSKINVKNKALHIMTLYLAVMSFCLVIIPLVSETKNIFILLCPYAIFAICLTMYNIHLTTYIQIRVEENYLGRVFSIIYSMSALFVPLGAAFFSIFLPITSVVSFVWIGLGIVLVMILVVLCSKHQK